MSKPARQKAILELVRQGPVASQDDLQKDLGRRGFRVGQATLSRDIHDLGLVKTSRGYALSSGESSEPTLPSVARLVGEFVLNVRPAQNLLVVKTTVGTYFFWQLLTRLLARLYLRLPLAGCVSSISAGPGV